MPPSSANPPNGIGTFGDQHKQADSRRRAHHRSEVYAIPPDTLEGSSLCPLSTFGITHVTPIRFRSYQMSGWIYLRSDCLMQQY